LVKSQKLTKKHRNSGAALESKGKSTIP